MHARVLFSVALLVGCDSAMVSNDLSSSDIVADASSATVDALDAGSPSLPFACGTTWCRAGQTCTAGVCSFACPSNSVRVPTQFSSLTAASQSLLGTGGAICITAAVTGNQFLLYDHDLHVVGVSPDVATIDSLSLNDGSPSGRTQPATVSMTGLGLGAIEVVTLHIADTVSLSASKIAGCVQSQSYAVGLSVGPGRVTLDGLDVRCFGAWPDCSAVGVYPGSGSTVIVRNSWLHDSQTGVTIDDGFSGALEVVNNTIVNNGGGINGNGRAHAVVTNNVIAFGQSGQSGFSVAGVSGHNAYWKTTFNTIQPSATDGDVSTDPMLDTNSPPGPTFGSPLVGAADSSTATSVDYFGRDRGAHPDIGAIQMQ